MKLVQTIQMMKSENYHERFKAEYFQLKIRHDRLVETVEKYKAGTLEFTPNCPMEVYKLQLEAMEKYLDVLVIRARIEGIELVEPKVKKKFKLEDYRGDYAMHCKTREEAEIFCNYLANHNRYWRGGSSYFCHAQWSYYKDTTAYAFNRGQFSPCDYYEDNGYKILEFSDFDWSNN